MYTQPEPTPNLLGGSPAPGDLFNFCDVTGGYMKSVSTSTLTSVFGGGGGGGPTLQISNCGGFLVPPTPTTLDFCDGLSVSYISAGNARAVITDGGVINTKLATMPANTVKVNNTAATGAPTDLTLGVNTVLVRSGGNVEALSMGANTVLGRAGNTNIAPLPIQDVLVGVGVTNASGQAVVTDSRITAASIGFATPRVGNIQNSVIYVSAVAAGSITFQATVLSNGQFNYQIYII